MKLFRISLLLVLTTVGLAMAEVELIQFRAYAQINRARLEWTTGNETNFDLFVVERSSDAVSFVPVATVDATGSFSEYEFFDSSPLDADMDRTFYYRLKMVDENGMYRYSDILDVALSFSAVQQTWGSIKAMFR